MGMFEVKVQLSNLASPGRAEEVSLIVDTGATLSWIPREILAKLGAVAFSRLPFSLADGRRLEREITAVLMTLDGRKAPVEVAFGEPGEEAVLGATALEGLGFMVDPVAKKLVARDLLALCAVREVRELFSGPMRTIRQGVVRRRAPWAQGVARCSSCSVGSFFTSCRPSSATTNRARPASSFSISSSAGRLSAGSRPSSGLAPLPFVLRSISRAGHPTIARTAARFAVLPGVSARPAAVPPDFSGFPGK